MKNLLCFAVVMGFLSSLVPDAQARVVTLVVNSANRTNEVSIAQNEVAELTSYSFAHAGANLSVQMEKDGVVTWFYLQPTPPSPVTKHVIAGPARLRVITPPGLGDAFYCTFTITPESFPPDRTIIALPGTNQTAITLECSTNLVNWVSATNGIYGPMPEAKFFRIKAQPAN